MNDGHEDKRLRDETDNVPPFLPFHDSLEKLNDGRIRESASGSFEGYPVFAFVRPILFFVPFEPHVCLHCTRG
jgi:hypothetical protein